MVMGCLTTHPAKLLAGTEGSFPVALKVTDSYALSYVSSADQTIVVVSNIKPVIYRFVSNVFNRRTGLYDVIRRMVVENVSGLVATDATATMTNVPAGVTVTDGSLSWATGASNDTFSYSYSRGTMIDFTAINWKITCSGNRHDIESLPQ